MNRLIGILVAAVVIIQPFVTQATAQNGNGKTRKISVKEYRDKMKAGWQGKDIGVDWGAPTEFKFNTSMVPDDKIPQFNPKMVDGGFNQDDLYVQMSFLRALDLHGINLTVKQAAIESAIASCGYKCWHANREGFIMVSRGGQLPPAAGHHGHMLDIDYQIDADFSGLVAPGQPNMAISLGEMFGGMINYSDGLYAGQFVGGMYTEAFFEKDVAKIIEAGLKCIPAESDCAQCISDCIKWAKENPKDYAKTWQALTDKWGAKMWEGGGRQKKCSPEIYAPFNLGVVVLGLIYGNGNPEETIKYAIKGGIDSDCNPATAAGVLFTSIGFSKLPEKFQKEPDQNKTYTGSDYTFPKLIDLCEKIARQAVVKSGGKIEKGADGDVFVIPLQAPKPSALMKPTDPKPKGETLTDAEKQQIKDGQQNYPWRRK